MNLTNTVKRNIYPLIFIIAFMLYGFSAGLKLTGQSRTPQYVYLAYSFLHGKTNLVILPESKFDLISFQDKWYVPGGITPALLLLPAVAIFGVTTSDVLFGVLIGSLNVTLMYSLLGLLVEKTSIRNWLTLLFAAGTVHWWLASMGSVWFNAQLVALLFMILFVRETIQGNAWLAGLCLGLAFLSRPPVIFSAIFYLLFVLSREHTLQSFTRKVIPFGLVLIGSVAVMLTYNYLRFENPTDFGYKYVVGSGALTSTYSLSGGFNPRYMSCNIYVSLFGMPNIDIHPLPTVNEACSYLSPIAHDFGKLSHFFNPLGMSIFLVTPAFFLIFRARLKDKLVIPAWAGTIAILVPLWMYHTTGWVQFGYRYTLDFIVFLFILLSQGIKQVDKLEKILIGSSVIMSAIGVYLMYYMTYELIWYEMYIEIARKIYHFLF